MEPADIRQVMTALETAHGEGHPPLGEVAARMLGLEHTEAFDQALLNEVARCELLCADWYANRVAVIPNAQALAIALVQGITFAAAARALNDDDPPIHSRRSTGHR